MPQDLELNEQSTTDEVTSYVDQMVDEIRQERAGESGKGDAQITSEHADNEKPPRKESTVENKSDGKGDEDSSGDGDSGVAWADDDVRADAAAYGIEESELAGFASREEFERALRLFDKSALNAGRKSLASQDDKGADGKQPRNEKGQFDRKEEPKPDVQDGRYQVQLSKDAYPDDIVGEFERLRDHYESRLQAIEQRFMEADARAEEQRFDSLIDSMGHADLFGKTGQENDKQLQRRQDLHIAVKAQQLGLKQLGRTTELNDKLVARVARMVFAEELTKKELKNHTRKVFQQSSGRMGGSAARPTPPREDPREEADRLYKELERSS